MKRQNVIYPKAEKALKTLGENLRLARKRRGNYDTGPGEL